MKPSDNMEKLLEEGKEADLLLHKLCLLQEQMFNNIRKNAPKEEYLDKCLQIIEDMQGLEDNRKNFTYLKNWYVKSSFDIYLQMQENTGKDHIPLKKEIPMSSLTKEQTRQVKGNYAKMNWKSIGHAKPSVNESLRGYWSADSKSRASLGGRRKTLKDIGYWAAENERKKR